MSSLLDARSVTYMGVVYMHIPWARLRNKHATPDVPIPTVPIDLTPFLEQAIREKLVTIARA